MFHDLLTQTALAAQKPDVFFQNRVFEGVCPPRDKVPVSFLRAFIYPRMEEGESLAVNEYYFDAYDSPASLRAETLGYPGFIENCVYFLEGNERNVDKEKLDAIQQVFEENGYVEIKNVRKIFERYVDIRCLIREDIRSSVFISSNLTNGVYHHVVTAMGVALPWYWERNKKWSDDEKELVNSLTLKDPGKFQDMVFKISEAYDFESSFVRMQLDGFESRIFDVRMRNLQDRIDNKYRNIRDYEQTISALLKEIDEAETRLFGYRYRADSIESGGVLDYFMRNKRLRLKKVDNDMICFYVKSKLTSFNPDAAEHAINAPNYGIAGTYGRYANDKVTREIMREVMRAIFVDQIMSIQVCAEFKISSEPYMDGLTTEDYMFPPDVIHHSMPNPHLRYYGCTSSNKSAAKEYLRNGNYIMAIEQCVHSAENLNFGDGSVMSRFMQDMYADRFQCIELPDGTFGTVSEAYEWLQKQKKEEES